MNYSNNRTSPLSSGMYNTTTLGTMRRRRSRGNVGIWILTAVALMVLIGGCLGARAAYQSTKEEVRITIVDAERVCKGQRDCEYLIFTEGETFKLADSSGLLGAPVNFKTSDLYGQIKGHVGEEVIATVYGWRIGFLSEYRTLTNFESVRGS